MRPGETAFRLHRIGSRVTHEKEFGTPRHRLQQFPKVTIGTINGYCAANSIGHISFLELDVEGHKLDALHGARKMFDDRSIDVVSSELDSISSQ
jgi:hypothetical protein